jgi:hypothetical protein
MVCRRLSQASFFQNTVLDGELSYKLLQLVVLALHVLDFVAAGFALGVAGQTRLPRF